MKDPILGSKKVTTNKIIGTNLMYSIYYVLQIHPDTMLPKSALILSIICQDSDYFHNMLIWSLTGILNIATIKLNCKQFPCTLNPQVNC